MTIITLNSLCAAKYFFYSLATQLTQLTLALLKLPILVQMTTHSIIYKIPLQQNYKFQSVQNRNFEFNAL